MSKRFSKDGVRDALQGRFHCLNDKWHFNPRNGYAQVMGRGEEANRAYAEWRLLLDIAEHFDVDISAQPTEAR